MSVGQVTKGKRASLLMDVVILVFIYIDFIEFIFLIVRKKFINHMFDII